jgi:hypothetical protein
MQKWEYLTIEISRVWVNSVNNKPLRKPNGDERYKLHEYLELIGKDGWEVVTSVNDAVIVKRPTE